MQNYALTNLNGLASLTYVGGKVYISSNAALTNLDGLANITSVGGALFIGSNYALTNLNGLAKITSVGGGLNIYNNALTNLDGLANITSVGGDLYIQRNAALTDCQGIALVLGWPNGPPDDNVLGTITIERNATGCNSVAQVLASFSPQAPTAPAVISTNYEDGRIILAVSVSNNGGAKITRYDATCTDGTNTYTGTSTSSPITVSGLTNGVAYTCTVTATNSVGTSSASAATAPITPEEQAGGGLPIWLYLYQATQ
jgi:hypothetical protein